MAGPDVLEELDRQARELAKLLRTDLVAYYGPISGISIKIYRNHLESLANRKDKPNRLSIFLTTPGGVVEVIEKLVEITRHHYRNVDFFVPDYAMSAGTIWCLSGDRIFMDYASSLGPVDPQIARADDGFSVPALGYIDQYNRMIEKSKAGELTDAEMTVLLTKFDLGLLRRFEQARDLAEDLIVDFLGRRPGRLSLWLARENIARKLSDNKIWHSHGRMIGMRTLQDVLGLFIQDFRQELKFGDQIRSYSEAVSDYAEGNDHYIFLHGSVCPVEGEPQ